MVQLPRRVAEPGSVQLDLVVGHRLPAVVIDGLAPEHLVVLGNAVLGGGCVLERTSEGHAVDVGGRRDAGHVEDGGHDVDGMGVLATQLAAARNPSGPVHDQRVGDATLVHLALPSPERRVAGDRPSPRVVVVAPWPAELVDAREGVFHRVGHEVPRPVVVGGPHGPALGAGAVVRQHHDDGVVELAQVGEVAQEAGEVVVGVSEEGGEGLHVAGVQPALVARQLVPCGNPAGSRRQAGALGDHTGRQLASERGVPPGIPSVVEATAEAVQPLGR